MTGEELVAQLKELHVEIEKWWVYGAFEKRKDRDDRYDGLRLVIMPRRIEVWPGGMRKAKQQFVEHKLFVWRRGDRVEYLPDSIEGLAERVIWLLDS